MPHPRSQADEMQALAEALERGTAAAVDEALARHPSLRSRLDEPVPGGSFGATALIVAVRRANRELVDALLAAGADIDQRSHWWAGGFHVLEHDHGLADFLIARGATLDAKSAATLGRLEDLRALLAADPGAARMRGGDGQTPLHVAATVAIAELLLEHGAELDALDVDHESTPAQYLVRSHPEVARWLVARGARCDLLMAAALGDLERVRAFLDADPSCIRTTVSPQFFPMRNPHAGGSIYTWALGEGKNAHVLAHEFGHGEVYELLVSRSPDSLKLAVACEVGDESAVTALLAARPGLAGSLGGDELRRLPLAARNDDTQAVRLMLDAGWPVDTAEPQGATALHWAGFHGNLAMTREILARGPSLDRKEREHGQTALGWALHGSLHGWHVARGDHAGVVGVLLDAGAKAPAQFEASEAVREVVRGRG